MSASRQRRYRARQQAGTAVLRVPVPLFDVAEMMIESGRLTEDEALDRRRVEMAAGDVLADLARRWLRERGMR